MVTNKIFIIVIMLVVIPVQERLSERITKYQIINSNSVYGIDISHHQGDINWQKVNNWSGNKIEFVYVKATEGSTYYDKTYKTNFQEAKKNGFKVGSYHYFRTTSSVEGQFANFVKHVDNTNQDLIPLVDVEEKKNWNNTEFHNNLQRFLDLVEIHFGKKPMIYTVNSFYNRILSKKYNTYHFLIGRYGSIPPSLKDNKPWTIWQFSEEGSVDGIEKKVDIDLINNKYNVNDLLSSSYLNSKSK